MMEGSATLSRRGGTKPLTNYALFDFLDSVVRGDPTSLGSIF
jgi:hypothetical protein